MSGQSRPESPTGAPDQPGALGSVYRRRPRYRGSHPRRFEEKYKEHRPDLYPETFEKVLTSGKTPAGSHRPIMVAEVLAALDPKPRQTGVDCTLGYGGHAQVLLDRIRPGGRLIAIDADPVQMPRTEARLRAGGASPEELIARRTNFAAVGSVLGELGIGGVDFIFADLGVSSMQLDDPSRGFTYKTDGPLDMRMNPHRNRSAAELIRQSDPKTLAAVLRENGDEPAAAQIALAIAGRDLSSTGALARELDLILRGMPSEGRDAAKRRVFQALRIAVNDEFAALESLLRALPGCLKAGGRIAILAFHSGEDRRVKHAFAQGVRNGIFSETSPGVIRPSPAEAAANPRSRSAKLRWAIRSGLEGGGV